MLSVAVFIKTCSHSMGQVLGLITIQVSHYQHLWILWRFAPQQRYNA